MPGLFSQLFRTADLERTRESEYVRLRARAEAREGDGATAVAIAFAIGAAVVWAGAGYGIAWAAASLHRPATASAASALPTPSFDIARVSLVNWIFALVAGLVAYFLVREWRLAKSMRRLLNKAGCPYCEFSLLGLTPHMGAVTCPECGEMVVLAEHHISPDALIVPFTAPPPDVGPLGSFTGEVPTGKKRRITRRFGGIPNRAPEAPKPSGGLGGGEML